MVVVRLLLHHLLSSKLRRKVAPKYVDTESALDCLEAALEKRLIGTYSSCGYPRGNQWTFAQTSGVTYKPSMRPKSFTTASKDALRTSYLVMSVLQESI